MRARLRKFSKKKLQRAVVLKFGLKPVKTAAVGTGACIFLLWMLFFPSSVTQAGEGLSPPRITHEPSAETYNRAVYLDIECRSGTPPVLNFVLKDHRGIVRRIFFDFESDGNIDLLVVNKTGESADEEKVIFRGVPYRARGPHKASLYLETKNGVFLREYTVAFTDFVWGRDNFSFANDGKYENTIDFVSATTIDWAEDRFGDLTPDQEIITLYVMYNIYKGSTGRCYGFSGGEAYYLLHPEEILYPYINTYSMDEWDKGIISQMDYTQNDIVFSSFVSGKIAVSGRQDNERLREEMLKLKENVGAGKPVILSCISKKIHHSMCAYGYFENWYRDKITVLAANNWARKSDRNIFSEDAESVFVQFVDDSRVIKWHDYTKNRNWYLEMLFVLDRDINYDPAPEDFFDLVRETTEGIIRDDKIIVMVENTEVAYIADNEGKKIGYKKPKQFKELDKISFKKIDYNYVFEIPRDGGDSTEEEYTLVIKKNRNNEQKKLYKNINIFSIAPGPSGLTTKVYKNLLIDDEREVEFTINTEGIFPKERS